MTSAATLEPLEQAHRMLREHLHVISPNGSLHYVGGIQEAAEAFAPLLAALATATAEVEALKAEREALRADANALGAKLGTTSSYDDPKWLRDLCWEAGNFLASRIVRPALARAATAREG